MLSLNTSRENKFQRFLGRFSVIGVLLIGARFPLSANLIITPTFDSTITSDQNAAVIEATINSVITTYEADLLDPIHVYITFQEISTSLGQSDFQLYPVAYNYYRAQLAKDATSADDAAAVTSLPLSSTNPVTGTGDILIKSANAKALGFSPIPDGVSDGTVSFNAGLTGPGSSTSLEQYGLTTVLEHEIDEVLGLGSTLGTETVLPYSNEPSPEDLFRYDAGGNRSFTVNGGAYAYFSIDGGKTSLAQFDNTGAGDYGDWLTGATLAQVQDAILTPSVNPSLGLELKALDVIGYNVSTTPEPSSVFLFASGVGVLFRWRRRFCYSARPE